MKIHDATGVWQVYPAWGKFEFGKRMESCGAIKECRWRTTTIKIYSEKAPYLLPWSARQALTNDIQRMTTSSRAQCTGMVNPIASKKLINPIPTMVLGMEEVLEKVEKGQLQLQ